MGLVFCTAVMLAGSTGASPSFAAAAEASPSNLGRAKVFLAAGDYRRAVDACLREVSERPSAASYVYLTYVYQALDGYLEHLARTEQWVTVGQVFLNLAARDVEDLVDPPDVLARMAKEIIQGAARQQSDVNAALATRLDRDAVAKLWREQAEWRKAKPDGWWAGVPEVWGW